MDETHAFVLAFFVSVFAFCWIELKKLERYHEGHPNATAASASKTEKKKSPFRVLTEEEKRVFCEKNLRNKVYGTTIYVALALAYCFATAPAATEIQKHEASAEKIICSSLGALANVLSLCCVFSAPVPTRCDRRYNVMHFSFPRVFIYLTCHLMVALTIYSFVSCVAELTGDSSLIAAVYRTAPFFTTLAIFFTILYLKFNWFDDNFRKETFYCREKAESLRFAVLSLGGHLMAVCAACVDTVLVKDPAPLIQHMPSCKNLLLACVTFVALYMALVHASFRSNGGWWPYAFCDYVFAGVPKEKSSSPIWRVPEAKRGSITKEVKFVLTLTSLLLVIQICTHFAMHSFL